MGLLFSHLEDAEVLVQKREGKLPGPPLLLFLRLGMVGVLLSDLLLNASEEACCLCTAESHADHQRELISGLYLLQKLVVTFVLVRIEHFFGHFSQLGVLGKTADGGQSERQCGV